MKAITVTQELKYLNPTLFTGQLNSIKTLNNLPKSFYRPNNNGARTDAYDKLSNTEHEADGFYDVVVPTYNSATQYLGSLYFNVDHFTYLVEDYTQEELDQIAQDIALSENETNKQTLIQQQLEQQVVEQAQASDDTTSLDNQALFPMWESGVAYALDYKVQDFNNNNELKLYKCVQAHTSQSDWRPKDVPALFSVVSYPGQIPVWVQPTGAQDAYNIGDEVYYPDENGNVYESTINANVWSPDALPSAWTLIN